MPTPIISLALMFLLPISPALIQEPLPLMVTVVIDLASQEFYAKESWLMLSGIRAVTQELILL
jgi:hypothetical protein